MNKLSLIAFLILALFSLPNCSKPQLQQKSISNAAVTDGTLGGGISDGNTGGAINPVDPLAKLDFKGRVESSDSNNNALAFDFDKSRGEFIIMIPMPSAMPFLPFGTFNNRPDITFSSIIDANGRTKFAVRIPVKYIIKGATFLPPAKLPNGASLPAMPAGYGELPSLALSFPQSENTQITVYIGINAVGMFVTLPERIAIPFGFQLPIKNSDKTRTLGFMTYVPQKGTYAPGLFLSTLIPPQMARILEDHLRL